MKQIIILDTQPIVNGGLQINCIFRYAVPSGAEVPSPGASSRDRNASTAEIAALQAGQLFEEPYSVTFPAGKTPAAMKAQLQATYADKLALFNARPNPNQFYGLAWDGTSWG